MGCVGICYIKLTAVDGLTFLAASFHLLHSPFRLKVKFKKTAFFFFFLTPRTQGIQGRTSGVRNTVLPKGNLYLLSKLERYPVKRKSCLFVNSLVLEGMPEDNIFL